MIATIAACSDGSGVIIDAAPIDGPAHDAVATTDAATIDAATIDGGPEIDGPTISPDAATTTLSIWTAASGQPPTQLCVPWVLNDTSTPEQPTLGGGELILTNDADAEVMYYLHPESVLALPALLVIEARMEFGSGGSQGPSRSGAAISFADGATDRKNSLFIDDGEVFLLAGENTRGATAAVPTTDAPHTYRIEVTIATGAIAVFRDSAPLLTGTTFVSPYDVTTAIYFGESSVVAHGTSIWEAVSHNALATIACP